MFSGFGLAAALVFAFALTYVASERDKKVDLAYFRTTRPGEVTRRIVSHLDQPIELAVFFPAGNEVREEVDNYVQDLSKESGELKIVHYDFDIDPLKGGIVDVVAEDVQEFDVRYFDPLTGQWVETWDTTQITGQPNRLPLEVSIRIVLKGVGQGEPYSYTTKVFLPIQQPLSFGIPKQ